MKDFYVYMLASTKNGAIYTGVTSDILRRVSEHREETSKGFTSRYGVKRLVWYEVHSEARNAIPAREEHQALVARVEGCLSGRNESGMERSL